MINVATNTEVFFFFQLKDRPIPSPCFFHAILLPSELRSSEFNCSFREDGLR